jgi:single stranded DNA-binding protein
MNMKDINKVILVGRLGGNPVQRYTKNGFPVVHFAVATSRKFYKDSSTGSESQESESSNTQTTPTVETQWHQIVAWANKAKLVLSI